jgi:hypothetical protein
MLLSTYLSFKLSTGLYIHRPQKQYDSVKPSRGKLYQTAKTSASTTKAELRATIESELPYPFIVHYRTFRDAKKQ